LLLGIGSTLSDIPTDIPYFAFIGRVDTLHASVVYVLLLFVLYCLIYCLPLLIIHGIFLKNQQQLLASVGNIEKCVDKIGRIITLLLLASLAIWLMVDITRYFCGAETLLAS
jgi:cytochrome c biogenesis protein CcdA